MSEFLKLFTNAVERSINCIAIQDLDGNIIYTNHVFSELIGFSQLELLDKPFHTLLQPDQVSALQDALIQVNANDGFLGEMQLRKSNGKIIPVSIQLSIFRSDEKNPIGIIARIRVLSDRKQAEAVFMRKEMDLISVFNCRNNILGLFDTHGVILQCNDAAATLMQMSIDELIGTCLWDLLPPDISRQRKAVFEKVIATSLPQELEDVQDGKTYYHSLCPILDEDGAVKTVVTFSNDITKQKQAEVALQESESRYRRLFEESNDAIFIHDVKGSIQSVNRSACEMLGYNKDELLSKSLQSLRPENTTLITEKAQREIKDIGRTRFISKMARADGEIIFVEISSSMIDEKNGIVQGIVRDISERKKMEEQLRQFEKMEAIGQLAGGVAHDFNNQLTGIMGFAELLSGELKDGKLKEYAQKVIDASLRSSDLIGKLLAFSRRGSNVNMPVNLHTTIDEAVHLLERSINKRVEIKQVLTSEPAITLGDSMQLINVFLNLGINGNDAMPNGGELIFSTDIVTFDEESCRDYSFELYPGRYVKVSVTDNGTGIAPDHIDRIFEPFFTTKDVGRGTGMGLSAVYGTVKSHHGAIHVYSEEGRGTTFKLYFPLEIETPVPVPAIPDKSDSDKTMKAKLLIVDDEKIILDIVMAMLLKVGCEVVACESGMEAIDIYRESWKEFDLVLLDMIMPEQSGYETFLRLKAINPNVKVLLSSGYALNEEARELLAQGVDDFIQKPYLYNELISKIKKTIRG